MYLKFSELLQKHKVSAYKVSKETGVSQQVLSQWKLGQSTPKIDKLQKIASYFDVPIEYFTDEEVYKDIKKVTPAENGRDDISEDLQKLPVEDRQYVKGIIKGLLAKNGLDE